MAYIGESTGDVFRGSRLWYIGRLDGVYENGEGKIAAFVHSELAEVNG